MRCGHWLDRYTACKGRGSKLACRSCSRRGASQPEGKKSAKQTKHKTLKTLLHCNLTGLKQIVGTKMYHQIVNSFTLCVAGLFSTVFFLCTIKITKQSGHPALQRKLLSWVNTRLPCTLSLISEHSWHTRERTKIDERRSNPRQLLPVATLQRDVWKTLHTLVGGAPFTV